MQHYFILGVLSNLARTTVLEITSHFTVVMSIFQGPEGSHVNMMVKESSMGGSVPGQSERMKPVTGWGGVPKRWRT